MVEVVPIDKRMQGLSQALGEYLDVASFEELEDIRYAIFDPRKDLQERKEAYSEHEGTISVLKPLFKQLIVAKNEYSRKEGFENFFQFSIDYNGVPKKDFKMFLERVDEFVAWLNKKIIVPPDKADWFWSKFNLRHSLVFNLYKKLDPQKYAYSRLLNKMQERRPELVDCFSQVQVKGLEKDVLSYPRTTFDEDKKTITVQVPFWRTDIHNVMSFLHELGHALVFVDLWKRGEKVRSKSKYWHEKEAIKAELELNELVIPQKIRNVRETHFLGTFSQTLFERQIYINPNAIFDEAYADIINRCFLKANQKRNPFYVLDHYLVARPCQTALGSVAKTVLAYETGNLRIS
ncbi:MAG: hypothetical protein ACOC4Z_03060 [Patescibacteria group bacterium]